jgi:hypothetical protein
VAFGGDAVGQLLPAAAAAEAEAGLPQSMAEWLAVRNRQVSTFLLFFLY